MSDDTTQAVEIERTFDAPVDVVWRMWTDPDAFAQWYGPTGASIPVSKMDLRVGGSRLVCMEMSTPDGTMQMWFAGEFVEIDEPNRLVYTESMADEDGRILSAAEAGMPDGHPTTTEVHVELTEVDGRTAMRMRHVGVPADSPGAQGWNMAFDSLEQLLAA